MASGRWHLALDRLSNASPDTAHTNPTAPEKICAFNEAQHTEMHSKAERKVIAP